MRKVFQYLNFELSWKWFYPKPDAQTHKHVHLYTHTKKKERQSRNHISLDLSNSRTSSSLEHSEELDLFAVNTKAVSHNLFHSILCYDMNEEVSGFVPVLGVIVLWVCFFPSQHGLSVSKTGGEINCQHTWWWIGPEGIQELRLAMHRMKVWIEMKNKCLHWS